MQPELAIDEAKLLRRNKPPMSDAHPVKWPIEIGFPEIQEIQEFRKLGGNIEVLPDIALQESRVIGPTVEDLCGR